MLYLVTDRGVLPAGADLAASVASSIRGGVTVVQLREKDMKTSDFIASALRIKDICHAAKVPLLINDRVDVALAADADGVHIGQDDMPLHMARKLLGQGKIVGVTVETREQALAAIDAGADYIGTSAVFATKTKVNTRGVLPLGIEGVAGILAAAKEARPGIPVITIGGINAENVGGMLRGVTASASGRRLAGVAVVSAILAKDDVEAAAREIQEAMAPHIEPTTIHNKF
ncbi:hypothetical protein HK101_003065 [Irineochytrium annulatum]|nr:hypothetical protein HK101_003065 [Irineochytrium annulatum]